MVARLPTVGGDDGSWGTVLNEYLSVEHNSDGTHSAGVDTTAIHDNQSGEISTLSEKVTPVSTDVLLIEDSQSSNVKKKVQIGNLPVTASGSDFLVNQVFS